jgi:DNA-3-methyladenine glycosylase II
MNTLRLTPRGPYSLAASAKFFCGFTPSSGTAEVSVDGKLTLGFLTEATFEPVVVSLTEDGQDIVGEISGTADAGRVGHQVARILSLDHDARGLAAVGERDPVIGRLLEATPGFRPVCFPSPYEAAVWGVLAQRISMKAAAAIKRRLSVATGARVSGFGQSFDPSPPPRDLLSLSQFPGLADEKLRRLHGVARAALDGRLDAGRLTAIPKERALEELRELRGVGKWTAAHILLRGCGAIDEVPGMEPRLLRGFAEAYGLREGESEEALARVSEGWRPYRMWVSILLVMSWFRGATRAREIGYDSRRASRERRANRALERAGG